MRVALCSLVGLIVLSLAQAQAADAIPGIGPTGPITKVEGVYQFTEGPAADRNGNVYFSDIPANRIYKIDPHGKVTPFLEPSGHTNGLMLLGSGEIAACQMDGQVVAISTDDKSIRPLAKEYHGARFNAPNDLVVDRAGGVYFTDPHFRAPDPLPQGKTAVYYANPAGEVTRLVDDLKAPNGVILSPDEQTLYVIPSQSEVMMAYPVESPSKLGAGREFCRLAQAPGRSGGGGDGLTIDTEGNLYITSGLGLQVFDKDGKALGVIAFPEQPANATFGGPEGKTLFVTARTGVYTAPMEAKGHVFPAGGK
ncbi:MAG: SMP-30/gluconolactonase/LRE family protein [Pirellulales bacterium]